MPYTEANYRDAHGVIVMCMHCRRTRRQTTEGAIWELVQEHIDKRPQNVSDGICDDCLEKHYPTD